MGALKPWHIIVLVLLVLLLFGAGKLPSLARNVGKSMRIFKSEVEELRGDDAHDGRDEDVDGDRRRSARGEDRRYDDRDRRYQDRDGRDDRYEDRARGDRRYDPREDRVEDRERVHVRDADYRVRVRDEDSYRRD